MLHKVRPGEEVAAIGSALTAIAPDRPDAALTHLGSTPQTAPVMAFSVLAKVQPGEVDAARDLLEDIEAMDADAALLQMARDAVSTANG